MSSTPSFEQTSTTTATSASPLPPSPKRELSDTIDTFLPRISVKPVHALDPAPAGSPAESPAPPQPSLQPSHPQTQVEPIGGGVGAGASAPEPQETMSATISASGSASAPISAQPPQSEIGNGPSTSPPASRIEEDVDVDVDMDVDADVSRLSESTTSPRSHTAKAEVESMAPESSPKDKVPIAATSSTVVKSRKSSCDLCHHRKIRCDQARPSCGSCFRKGHACHYSDETEGAVRPSKPSRAATVVSSTHPSEKLTVPVLPSAQPSPAVPRVGPEWSAVRSKPKGGGGGVEPRKAQRDRILNGFDSDSEDESSRSVARSAAGRSVEGELAELVGGPTEEIDELDSGNEGEPPASVVSSGKKREPSADDELAGELLELASGPPKKKKPKPVAAPPLPPPAPLPASRPVKPAPRPRGSLSATTLPPTPASSTVSRLDHYATPIQALMSNLPSSETQTILFDTFFTDPFLTEGISLLQPQYLEDFRSLVERRGGRYREGDATTLACAFAFLGVALRILPEETSRLLLASTASSSSGKDTHPKSLARILVPTWPSSIDSASLDQRYFDLAIIAMQVADQYDMPSVMLVMCKLTLVRFVMMRMLAPQSGPMALAGGWLAHAIKIAHSLGMGKEWEGIPQGERELRRRVMWTLYNSDRHWSFLTANPYTILDAHQGIHLPSPISEADLYKIPAEASSLPPHSTEVGPTACTALFIHTHLARRITPILDSFATVSPTNTPPDLVLRFDASLDAFQEALPPYFRLFPQTDTHWDSSHPYLASHRVRLHATLLGYRMGVHRSHLPTYLLPITPPNIRAAIAQVCLSTLRVQRSAKMLDPKVAPRVFSPVTVFEAAATLGLIMYVEKALGGATTVSADTMVWRGGVAEAGELLDNVVSPVESAAFARRAVTVVREIMVKVDSPSTKSFKHEPTTNGDEVAERETSVEKTKAAEEKTAGITAWMEKLLTEGMHMDLLLREPEWEGGWEKVVSGM